MATTALAQSLFDTNAASGVTFTTASFTPAAGDHLCGLFTVVAELSTDWTVTDSLSGAWTKVVRALRSGSGSFMELWVRNTSVSGAAMTVTFSHAAGAPTGFGCAIWKTTGMSLFGSGSIKQNGIQQNQALGATPTVTFGVAALTGNVIVGGVNALANPPAITEPSGWTEDVDSGHATPNAGIEAAHVNSGFTSTTVTWGSTSAGGQFCTIAAELDTSGAAVALRPPTLAVRGMARNRASVY